MTLPGNRPCWGLSLRRIARPLTAGHSRAGGEYYGVGAGILNRLNNGWVLDTSIEWKHASSGILIGAGPLVTSSARPFNDAFIGTVRVKF